MEYRIRVDGYDNRHHCAPRRRSRSTLSSRGILPRGTLHASAAKRLRLLSVRGRRLLRLRVLCPASVDGGQQLPLEPGTILICISCLFELKLVSEKFLNIKFTTSLN